MTEKNNAGVQPPASEWTDPDDPPELTEAFFADAEVFQGDAFFRRGRGRPPTGKAKELVSLRLNRDVLAKLREAGPGWQLRVSDLLRLALDMREVEKTMGSPVLAGREPAEMREGRGRSLNLLRLRLGRRWRSQHPAQHITSTGFIGQCIIVNHGSTFAIVSRCSLEDRVGKS